MSFWDLFDPGHAYKAAGREREKYYGQGQQYLDPYNQNGLNAGNNLNQGMNALMNPEQLQNQWAQGYEMSPYAQQSLAQSNSNGMDAASQMGLMGSSAALGNIQQTGHNVMQQDRQQYMNDLMQKYLAGTGLAQSMYGTGANAAGQQAGASQQMGQDMGQMAYGKNASRNQMLMGLLGQGLFGGMGGGGQQQGQNMQGSNNGWSGLLNHWFGS